MSSGVQKILVGSGDHRIVIVTAATLHIYLVKQLAFRQCLSNLFSTLQPECSFQNTNLIMSPTCLKHLNSFPLFLE
jgi:hypothetical protein